jgi:uncharacterized protein with PIN domain
LGGVPSEIKSLPDASFFSTGTPLCQLSVDMQAILIRKAEKAKMRKKQAAHAFLVKPEQHSTQLSEHRHERD